MKASHLGVFGGTGSGKTSYVRMLVENLPRLLVLDHSEDPIWDTVGSTLRDPGRAMRFYLDNVDQDFRTVLRFRDPEDYLPFLGAAIDLHERYELPPLVLVMEEATEWSESWELPDELEAVVTRGRKHGLVAVTIVQETTQVHRTIRRNTFASVIFRHRELTDDLQKILDRGDQERALELEPLDPHTTPERGRHYIVHPDVNPYRRLLEATAASQEELPEDYRPPQLDPSE